MGYHPEFDPLTKTWFLTKPKVEANSIAGLLQKLEPGAVVQDYYQGRMPFDLEQALLRKPAGAEKQIEAPPVPETKKRTYEAAWVRTADEEAALEMWGNGMVGTEIAKQLGRTSNWIGTVLQRGRRYGDPRAKRRNEKAYQRSINR